MSKQNICLLFLLYLVPVSVIFGQEEQTNDEQKNDGTHQQEPHEHHFIGASINHTVIFSAVKDGENKGTISLPSFGIGYTYFFNEKIGIGLHSDIIIEDFVVESGSTDEENGNQPPELELIERGTPLAVAVVFMYKPLPFLGLMAGAGREFSKHEDFNLIRLGIEAPFNISHHWEVFAVLTYDVAIDAYDSLNYGIGIGKMF